MKNLKNNTFIALVGILLIFSQSSFGQENPNSELYKTIAELDHLIFEKGFNECKLEVIASYISDDLEFYHDQSGISTSKKEFLLTFKNNLCSNWEVKPIRKLTEGSIQVFPLYNEGVLYGAIQQGVHEFYLKESGKELYLTSTAKFTHLWIKGTDNWKLKRVLSYDHQNPKKTIKTEVKVTHAILKKYVGDYKSPRESMKISIVDNNLQLLAGQMQLLLYPETKSIFFSKEAPLTFEFVANTKGKTIKIIVRENGNVVEEAKKISD